MSRITSFLIIGMLIFGCGRGNQTKEQPDLPTPKVEVTEFPEDGTGKPRPKFDMDIYALIEDYRTQFSAEGARISRPVSEIEGESTSEFWLKVLLVNPEVDDFDIFARKVAEETYSHLVNPEEFDRIEIEIRIKKGSVISITTSQNKFFNRDELNIQNDKNK